jgi:hypothetical protein
MRRLMRRISALLALAVGIALANASGCGGPSKPPERGVIEADLKTWKFRRYQALLDIEVWVPKNRASAHTASYVRTDAEKRGRLEEGDVVSAFVTRYERDEGVLRSLIVFCRRLAQEQGYAVEERRLGKSRVFQVTGAGEAWIIWGAERHVVKIGGRGLSSVPESVVAAYASRYPSALRPGMLEGPLPEGPEEPPREDPGEPFDPENPRPDWQD